METGVLAVLGGPGLFVWGALGLVCLGITAEVLGLVARRRALVRANAGEAEDASDEA